MAAFTCTLEDLVNGCLDCQSDRTLMAVLATVTARINDAGGAVRTPATLMSESSCFKCESKHEILAILASILGQFAIGAGYYTSLGDLINDSACLDCADPAVVRGIIAKEMCEYVDAIT